MKKLLLTLGTVAAVAAPVAAVVACSNDDAKIESYATYEFKATGNGDAEITALLAKIGYEGKFGLQEESTDTTDFTKLDGVTATIFQGNKGEGATETHGSDDFAIVLKGSTDRPTSTLTDWSTEWPIENKGEAAAGQEDADHSSAMNFGDKAGKNMSLALQDTKAFAVIFVQNDGTAVTTEYIELKTGTKDGESFPVHKIATYDQNSGVTKSA